MCKLLALILTPKAIGKKFKKDIQKINKRAQRALCRSPEEKVKDHSGSIYRGPLMVSTKYW